MQRLRIVLYSMCTTLKYVLQRKIYQRDSAGESGT